MSANPKNKANTAVLVRDGPADYQFLSTATKPVVQAEDVGAILEATDTGDRYRWTGTKWVLTQIAGRVVTADFYTEVAQGNIEGYSTIHKYGVNPDIDIASGFEVLWNGGGDYTGHDCTAAETLETFSSSADDIGTVLSTGTATGGSRTTLVDAGATFVSDGVAIGDAAINDTQQDHAIITALTETSLTFITTQDLTTFESGDTYRIVTSASTGSMAVKLIYLLDGNLANETSEYIVLNGTTPVDTVSTYRRHSRSKAFGVGDNVGSITTRQKTTTANITMVMPVGGNSTLIAAYTIPADKRGFFTSWFASKAKKQASFSNIRLMIRPVNSNYSIKEQNTISSTGTSAVQRTYDVPKDSLMPGTDIKIQADTDTNDNGVAGGFDLILVDL